MRRITLLRTLGIGIALVAVLGMVAAVAAAPPGGARNFTVPLSGDEEVPMVDTRARGVGIFHLSADGTELSYRLVASNITNVMMAHIHCCAATGVNTGIAVWLYPDAPPPQVIEGRHNGTLATGTITAADIIGPPELLAADDPLAALVEQMRDGNAYVNVHTTANPSGEIRGQLP